MNDASTDVHGTLVTGGGRTLEELKQEVLRRVERGLTPVGGIRMEDAKAALSAIDSRPPDHSAPHEEARHQSVRITPPPRRGRWVGTP